jgi:hypothetical protein
MHDKRNMRAFSVNMKKKIALAAKQTQKAAKGSLFYLFPLY